MGSQSLWRYGRWAMFRLGLALVELGASPETKKRLIIPNQYGPCAAELDVGLWLTASCAVVQHEPTFPLSGPDFFACPKVTKLGWEVKQPQQSRALIGLTTAVTWLSMNLNRFTAQVAETSGLAGWSIELIVSEERLALAIADADSQEDLENSLQEMITRWAVNPRKGFVRAADCGVEVRRNATKGIQVTGPGFADDANYETQRLQRLHLAKAAQQLEAGGIPGFIVLAREQSGLIGNHARGLTQWIREQPEQCTAVLGLVIYDRQVDDRNVLASRAHLHLRSESRSLIPELSVLRRAGQLSLSLF